jgi:hypothetical protein
VALLQQQQKLCASRQELGALLVWTQWLQQQVAAAAALSAAAVHVLATNWQL